MSTLQLVFLIGVVGFVIIGWLTIRQNNRFISRSLRISQHRHQLWPQIVAIELWEQTHPHEGLKHPDITERVERAWGKIEYMILIFPELAQDEVLQYHRERFRESQRETATR